MIQFNRISGGICRFNNISQVVAFFVECIFGYIANGTGGTIRKIFNQQNRSLIFTLFRRFQVNSQVFTIAGKAKPADVFDLFFLSSGQI